MRNGGNNAWLATKGLKCHESKLTGAIGQVNGETPGFTRSIRNVYALYINPAQ
jgi:hypothetical protein